MAAHALLKALQPEEWTRQSISELSRVLPWAITHVVVLFMAYRLLLSVYRVTLHPLSSLPGPRLASVSDLYAAYHLLHKQDGPRQFHKNHGKYGPVVRQGPNRIIFNTTTALHAIYRNTRLTKSHSYDLMKHIGEGNTNLIVMTDREEYRRKRRVIGRAISDRTVRAFNPVMSDQITIFLRKVLVSARSEEPVNMTTLTRHLTFDVVAHFAFSHALHLQTEERNRWLIEANLTENSLLNAYINIPDLFQLRIHSILDFLDSASEQKFETLFKGMREARLSKPKDAHEDVYSAIADIPATDDGKPLEEAEIFAEASLLFRAGGDTTAAAICATLFYLSRNRDAYHRLTGEIRSTFESSKDIGAGTELSSCEFLQACIDEAIRMSPPVGGIFWREQVKGSREAGESLIIAGQVIPPGTQIGVCTYAIQHNELYFPLPFTYMPERWLASESSEEQRRVMHRAFNAFSSGSRSCPGQALAYAEMTSVVAKLIWYFDFSPAPGSLGKVGLRFVEDTSRHLKEEFDTKDIFTSKHDGPYLTFKLREGIDSSAIERL